MKTALVVLNLNPLRYLKMKNPGFFLFCLLFFTSLLIYFPVFASQTEEENPSVPVMVEEAAESLVSISVIIISEIISKDAEKDAPFDMDFNNGTGFVIDGNTVITNFHVIRKFKSGSYILITSKTGKRFPFKRITHLSALDDLAVLEIEDYEGPSLKLGTLPSNIELIPLCTFWAHLGMTFLCDNNYTLGFPENNFSTIKGKFIDNNFLEQKDILIISDTKIMDLSGMSGGPMVNDQGEIMGVVFKTNARSSENEVAYLYGTPVDTLKELLDQPELPLDKPEDLIQEEIVKLKTLAEQGNTKAQTLLFLFWKHDNNLKKML